jgi:hypothetical protein
METFYKIKNQYITKDQKTKILQESENKELQEENITELKENDLFNAMEDGTVYKNKISVLNTLNYDNNYSSEDENLVILNTGINKSDGFCKKLEYKDVEYRIDRTYFDINHKYSSALDILASYLLLEDIFATIAVF